MSSEWENTTVEIGGKEITGIVPIDFKRELGNFIIQEGERNLLLINPGKLNQFQLKVAGRIKLLFSWGFKYYAIEGGNTQAMFGYVGNEVCILHIDHEKPNDSLADLTVHEWTLIKKFVKRVNNGKLS